MRHAESVTFGGAGLDRAAELRGDGPALDRLRQDSGCRIMALWRGKPLVGPEGLTFLPPDHPVLREGAQEIFLGRDNGSGVFAADLSPWQPDEVPATLDAFADPTEQRHPLLPDDQRFVELRGVMARLSPRDAEFAATARAILNWHRIHRFCARCGAPSDVCEAGWQRLCPACGAHHFPRTDPVVIMLITHGNSVLLGRQAAWPEGMYSLLAGFVEPGETLEAAVRRETAEEAGIRVGRVGYLASQPWPFPASLMIGCHGHALTHDIRVDETELEDALWMTREAVMDAFAGTNPSVLPARPGAIARFLLHNWLADRLE